jgi:preprotein translocase subunit SecD
VARSIESRGIKVRAGLIIFFLALAILFLIPSLPGSLPRWWKVLPSEKIHLGLDLQGGMYLLLEVEVQKAVASALDKYAARSNDLLTIER